MSELLRSFLVSVGVDVDEDGMRRFDSAVKGVTKTVTALGAAVTAAAAATTAAVVKISDQFDDLYYASQRLRASVVNIKAFDYGVSQMGGNAQAARASMEGLADFMRSNPGGDGFIASLGVGTRDAAGNLRDTTDVMRDLGDRFRQMPYFLAKMRAGMMGIDENTLQALIRGTDLWSSRYRDMAGKMGVDFDRASEASARFMQNVRDLKAQIELGLFAALLKLQDAIGPGLQRAAKIGIKIMEAFAKLIGRLVDFLAELDDKTDGWSTAILAVTTVLAILVATIGAAAPAVAGLAAAIALLVEDFLTWREGGKSLIDWETWSGEIDAAVSAIQNLIGALGELGDAFAPIASVVMDVLGPALEWFGRAVIDVLATKIYRIAESIRALAALMRGDLKAAAIHSWNSQFGFPARGQSVEAREHAAASNDNAKPVAPASGDDALNYFMRMGWTREQAAGIVANLNAESKLDPRAVGDGGKAFGIAQWHPDRQAAFKRAFGKDIRNSTLQEQLAFVHYELVRGDEMAAGDILRATKTARQAGQVVSKHYERPRDQLGEMAKRGAAAEALIGNARVGGDRAATVVNVNSKTDIKVTGNGDAKEVAKQVETAADRAYATMLRNTRGAVR